MAHDAPVLEEHFCGCSPVLVSLEITDYDFPIPHIGSRRIPGLLPVGLFKFWTVNIFEVDHLLFAVMIDRQTIAFMDGDDPRDKIRPRESRPGSHRGEEESSYEIGPDHESYASLTRPFGQLILEFLTTNQACYV